MYPISPTRLRRLVQLCFVLFFVWVVWRLYGYAQWAAGSGEWIPRPASAEAALPLSALLGLKHWLLTGEYDPVHPAGLTILLVALCSAVVWRRGFCGFLCPVGWLSGLLGRMGQSLGVSCRPGRWLERLLSAPKYLLLGVILYAFVLKMGPQETEWFLRSPYNLVADIKMLRYFLEPGGVTIGVLVIMSVGSLFLPGFWCRGFCPYGALLGLLSLLSPAAVVRNTRACTGCGRCVSACPSRLPVSELRRLSGPECHGCAECVSACPTNCLEIHLGYGSRSRRIPAWSFVAGTLILLFAAYGLAVATGHWDATLPLEMIRRFAAS